MEKLIEETNAASIPSEPTGPPASGLGRGLGYRMPKIRKMRYCNRCNSIFWGDVCEACNKKDDK